MNPGRSKIAAALVAACFTLPAPARAAGSDDELRATELAYRNVDFVGTEEHANAGLAAGGARPERVARFAVLAGMSAAALDRNDEARTAFVLALALVPDLKLDKTLSPKLRGPYLEAQGYWAAYTDRLSVRADAKDGSRVVVRLADPARLVSRVVVSVRARGQSSFLATPFAPKDAVVLPIPAAQRARGFEYFVQAQDANANILAETGTEDEPLAYADLAADLSLPPEPEKKQRSYVLPVTFAALGAGATALGVVFHLKREDAAREWNGPGCEQPGKSTRLQQCGDIDDDIRRDGRIAIAGYVAGGLFLTTAVVTWFTGAPRREDARAETAAKTACAVVGAGFACSGQF